MTEFVIFCVPTIIYVIVQSRGTDRTWRTATSRAGLAGGRPRAYGWAVAMLFPLILTAWLAVAVIPSEVLNLPGVSIEPLTSVGVALAIVLRAVGEEIFFRGLLAGVLIRRLGFL